MQYHIPNTEPNVSIEDDIIAISDLWYEITDGFKLVADAEKSVNSYAALLQSLETFGPKNEVLQLIDMDEHKLTKLLQMDELPTAEQWEELNCTEIVMESATEAVKKAISMIKAFFEWMGNKIGDLIFFIKRMTDKTKKEVEDRFNWINKNQNLKIKDRSVTIPKAFYGDLFQQTPDILGSIQQEVAAIARIDFDEMLTGELNPKDAEAIRSRVTSASVKLSDMELSETAEIGSLQLGFQSASDVEDVLRKTKTLLDDMPNIRKSIHNIKKNLPKIQKKVTEQANMAGRQAGRSAFTGILTSLDFAAQRATIKKSLSTLYLYTKALRIYSKTLVTITDQIVKPKNEE